MSDRDLKEQLTDEMKAAMRAKDKARLSVIRLALAAFKQREVDERITLDQTQSLAILDKMLKQRRDSLEQFESAGRQDLADQESYEIGVIQEFMPTALGADELTAIISAAISSSGAESMKDMGKVMGVVKAQVQGRADMGKVSQQIKALLNA